MPTANGPVPEGMVGLRLSESALRGFAWRAHRPVRETITTLQSVLKNVKPLCRIVPSYSTPVGPLSPQTGLLCASFKPFAFLVVKLPFNPCALIGASPFVFT